MTISDYGDENAAFLEAVFLLKKLTNSLQNLQKNVGLQFLDCNINPQANVSFHEVGLSKRLFNIQLKRRANLFLKWNLFWRFNSSKDQSWNSIFIENKKSPNETFLPMQNSEEFVLKVYFHWREKWECTVWPGNVEKTVWAIEMVLGESAQFDPEMCQKPYELLRSMRFHERSLSTYFY